MRCNKIEKVEKEKLKCYREKLIYVIQCLKDEDDDAAKKAIREAASILLETIPYLHGVEKARRLQNIRAIYALAGSI